VHPPLGRSWGLFNSEVVSLLSEALARDNGELERLVLV